MAARKRTDKKVETKSATSEIKPTTKRKPARKIVKRDKNIVAQTIEATSDVKDSLIKKFQLSKRGYFLLTLIGLLVILFVLGNKFLVVAWVDKKPITRFEFYNALEKRYGKDLKDELIVERLLNDEAAQKKIVVTDNDVNNEIKKIEDQQGGADKLNQVLSLQNLTRDDLKRLVKLQLLRTKIFSDGVVITDQDVTSYIDANKDVIQKDANGNVDDKTKQSIKDQLKQQKINDNFNKWLSENLNGPRVNRTS